jgi:putative flavoprotein involved in K+ transport
MRRSDVVIIGGGQSGLVMSRSLSALGIEHVVLERGRVGERWHSERWRSLHLLTPSSLSALPGLAHAGAGPDDFLAAADFANYLGAYAETISAPVIGGSEVSAVERIGDSYRISTGARELQARAVVVATGACDTPFRPALAERMPAAITQYVPSAYRTPDDLPVGGVLIVGASATGIQLAEEIQASGRRVTLAVGEHTRMPRRYRGRDIYTWLEATGILDERFRDDAALRAALGRPSLQLVGRADFRDLDLHMLKRRGVRLVGRLADCADGKACFAGDLERTTRRSHARMTRVLERIDSYIEREAIPAQPAWPSTPPPAIASCEAQTIDLAREGIRSVIWATGYVRRYPWLKVPVLDDRGEIVHRAGVTGSPGLYVIGLNFLRRRSSSLIHGCGRDADELAPLVKAYVATPRQRAA